MIRGGTYLVNFTETVYHTGYFGVSLSMGGQDVSNFTQQGGNIADGHARASENVGVNRFSYSINVPTQNCAPGYCIIQTFQLMEDSDSYYYSCGDVEIVDQAKYTSLMATCEPNCNGPVFSKANDTCICDYWQNSNTGGNNNNNGNGGIPRNGAGIIMAHIHWMALIGAYFFFKK